MNIFIKNAASLTNVETKHPAQGVSGERMPTLPQDGGGGGSYRL